MKFLPSNCPTKILFNLAFAAILFGCSSGNFQKNEYLVYNILCSDCEKESNHVFKFNFPKQVDKDTSYFLQLTNISNDVIQIDENMCSITFDKELVFYPIGIVGPNDEFSYSATLEKGIAEGSLQDRYFMTYFSQTHTDFSKSITNTHRKPNIIPLPPGTSFKYVLKDLFQLQLNMIKEKIGKRFSLAGEFNFAKDRNFYSNVQSELSLLNGKEIKINLVYKKLNESIWNYTSISHTISNMSVIPNLR